MQSNGGTLVRLWQMGDGREIGSPHWITTKDTKVHEGKSGAVGALIQHWR